jgi:pimeloyl-ACP methyl ester carboxylesterase
LLAQQCAGRHSTCFNQRLCSQEGKIMTRYADVNPMNPNAFEIHRTTVRDGIELAYVREGKGGTPLLLLHGWPATKRIFYRNIGPLADAGFDVIAPDASGWGDSPLPAGRYADPIGSAHDFKALMEHLGHQRWVLGGFDFGSLTAMHMVNRFPEQIIRQVLWNAVVPFIPEEYERAGIGGDMIQENEAISDHVKDHGDDPDTFAQRYDSPQKRCEYVMGFYQQRVWKVGHGVRRLAAPGSFDDEAAGFHAQPFTDAGKFRASLNYYAALTHPERCFEPPLLHQKVGTETMFLYGVADEIIGPILTRRAEVAYTNLVGPFHVQRGGHFLSWERPTVVNSAIACFCRDLLTFSDYDAHRN